MMNSAALPAVSDYLLSGVEDCGGCGYEPQMEESPSAGYDAGMR